MQKQILLTVATVALAAGSVRAQDFTQFRFGLNLSPSLSWINTNDNGISGDGTALGLKLATQAEFFFAENYAIESGIGFHFNAGGTLNSTYGGRFFQESLPEQPGTFNSSAGTPAGGVAIDYAIQYIEIPLALKLRTREFGYLTYYLQAPIFTLGIRAKNTGGLAGGGVPAELEDVSANKEVTPFALSWGFGGGAEYAIAESTHVFAGLTFQRIFTDVTKDKDYTYEGRTATGDPKGTINSLTLRLGVLF